MGMFDDVRCDYPTPDGHKGPFQSKDMDCNLDKYVITAEGRLMLDGVDQNFHGYFNFYDFDTREGKEGVWHEYNAKFTDGQLIEIEQVTGE